MKRQAAGAPPIDGARKVKRTLTAQALKTLRFSNFTGEISVVSAERGLAKLAIGHADLHCPDFVQQSFGWDVA